MQLILHRYLSPDSLTILTPESLQTYLFFIWMKGRMPFAPTPAIPMGDHDV